MTTIEKAGLLVAIVGIVMMGNQLLPGLDVIIFAVGTGMFFIDTEDK
jgi:ABC-type uncharacterized transport system permease subunit